MLCCVILYTLAHTLLFTPLLANEVSRLLLRVYYKQKFVNLLKFVMILVLPENVFSLYKFI